MRAFQGNDVKAWGKNSVTAVQLDSVCELRNKLHGSVALLYLDGASEQREQRWCSAL